MFTIETNNPNRALIAMSGGVDSSVAAYLMKRAGYDCVGATMRLYENEDVTTLRTGTCCSLEDVEDARAVAARLGMPYYVFNFKEDFGRQVMDRFVAAYEGGCTPNPCIDCNRYLKFDRMYRRARELGIGYVVTGHYARIQHENCTGYFGCGNRSPVWRRHQAAGACWPYGRNYYGLLHSRCNCGGV